jgi:hypothetical protein
VGGDAAFARARDALRAVDLSASLRAALAAAGDGE